MSGCWFVVMVLFRWVPRVFGGVFFEGGGGGGDSPRWGMRDARWAVIAMIVMIVMIDWSSRDICKKE